METEQKKPWKQGRRAERPLQLYLLVQQHGLPQTPQGRAALLCDAGYRGVIISGHRRRASLLPENYREILCYDPEVGDHVRTGTHFPEQDFEDVLFRFFNDRYQSGKRAAEQQCEGALEVAVKAPQYHLLAPPSFQRVEEIVDDEGDDPVPLTREHGEAYEQARTRMGYSAG